MILRHWKSCSVAALLLFLQAAAFPVDQVPLAQSDRNFIYSLSQGNSDDSQLHGRFLHISDLHPDPFYKYHSSVGEEKACHRGTGPAGYYGAETTSCDSPMTLINATFQWIDQNLKDKIDFVVWTGDSARHDNDPEKHSRTEKQVHDLNQFCVDKFVKVFGENRHKALKIPVVPTWGNNDVLPHNVFHPGPNKWTKAFLKIWQPFIPESQRHSFHYGGWFYVEVIPNKLAVFSLNSLYFFDNNAAVDGCADTDQPGYAQFEWMRVQLQYLRERGMKAIMIGHVPPARTDSKTAWDETCWQKYNLWMHQYRDVVVGSAWGHMNIDHFMLQDFEDVDITLLQGNGSTTQPMYNEITVEGASSYLSELRELWSELPAPPKGVTLDRGAIEQSGKKDKFFKKIGGPFGERYSLSLVSSSVVPNYYPTLRIIEYNISGLDAAPQVFRDDHTNTDEQDQDMRDSIESMMTTKKKFKVPKGPSKSTPPGPAYSPQTFTWTKYTQLFANLTVVNNDFGSDIDTSRWKEGKHHNKKPNSSPRPNPKKLEFEVEYNTAEDEIYKMPDLTVLSYLKLAETIGNYKPGKSNHLNDGDDVEANKKHKKGKKDKKKKKKKKKRKLVNKFWHAFVSRAFVNSMDEDQLRDEFGQPVDD